MLQRKGILSMDRRKRKAFHTTRAMIIGILGLVLLIGAMVYAWSTNRPDIKEGSKSITVQVVDDKGEITTYTHKTDAFFLMQALEEIDGLMIEGDEGDYGLYIKSINGLRAVYELDNAYWGIYVNGEYATQGVDTQPVADGDTFKLSYEPA